MSRNLIIFGAGSMARVLMSFVGNWNVQAFCADDEFVDNDVFCGKPLVKLSDLERVYPPERGRTIVMAIGYHEMNQTRMTRFGRFKMVGYKLGGYVHSSVAKHDNVYIDPSAIVYDSVALHSDVRVAANVFISSNVSVGHDCLIEAHAWLNSGVSLGGGVTVGHQCVLGMGATVAHGVKLGARTYVGANALVTRNTEPGAVIVQPAGSEIRTDSKRFLKLIGTCE